MSKVEIIYIQILSLLYGSFTTDFNTSEHWIPPVLYHKAVPQSHSLTLALCTEHTTLISCQLWISYIKSTNTKLCSCNEEQGKKKNELFLCF